MADASTSSDPRLGRLRQRDVQALAEFFAEHRQRLLRIVEFRLDNRLAGRVDADDILQESYLAAAQRIEHVDCQSATTVFVWLRLIVSQTLVDVHRRHLGAQRRDAGREISLQRVAVSPTTSISLAAQLLGNLTSPSQALLKRERQSQLEQALEEMPPIDREVLALRHFEELSNSEVAAVLDIQQKAASIRYVRALGRLKKIMEAHAVVDER